MATTKEQRLFAAARTCFAQNGFKRTSIADIAAAADVAVGTFYNFYDSKAAIFLAVYNAENEAAKREILAQTDLDAEPVVLLTGVLQRIFAVTQENRILQEWFANPQLNAKIAQGNQDWVTGSYVYATLEYLIAQWHQQGRLRPEMTPARAMGLFNALTVMDLHQSEIQTTDYQQLLTDMVRGILTVILK